MQPQYSLIVDLEFFALGVAVDIELIEFAWFVYCSDKIEYNWMYWPYKAGIA